jgi:hypothetical protein
MVTTPLLALLAAVSFADCAQYDDWWRHPGESYVEINPNPVSVAVTAATGYMRGEVFSGSTWDEKDQIISGSGVECLPWGSQFTPLDPNGSHQQTATLTTSAPRSNSDLIVVFEWTREIGREVFYSDDSSQSKARDRDWWEPAGWSHYWEWGAGLG